MILGTLIPSHYEHTSEVTARYSSAGEKVARDFNPSKLQSTKKRVRTQKARNAVEAVVCAQIDKRSARKAEKLARREAKRRGLV